MAMATENISRGCERRGLRENRSAAAAAKYGEMAAAKYHGGVFFFTKIEEEMKRKSSIGNGWPASSASGESQRGANEKWRKYKMWL
jgi:hypothetical protein